MRMVPCRRDERGGREKVQTSSGACVLSLRMTCRPVSRASLPVLSFILVLLMILVLGGCGETDEDQTVATSAVELTVVEDDPETVELNVVVDDEAVEGESTMQEEPENHLDTSSQENDDGVGTLNVSQDGVRGDKTQQDGNDQQKAKSEESDSTDNGANATFTYTTWSEEAAPEYYRIVGNAEVVTIPEPGTAVYSPLDALGRSGQAAAYVTHDMMEAGRARNRKSLSSISPSGWGDNPEVDIPQANGDIYHGQFWNRSHLIAKSLGGDDIQKNLVTGTRMQNVGSNGKYAGGMGYCENLARMWLDDNPDGWLAYVATPVYEGSELVCRSVIVDMRSSDGSLDVRVEVYNAAKGYAIDYATGTFSPNA